ncbi:hypothetical protein V7111_23475 [Neobacillus niacini]|uniref:hypothetical protein n=1 Tax=Neobacillus niacini TaxID=86668 RepID=UPI003001649C
METARIITKGPAPIPIPDEFTIEWYTQQKEAGVSDRNIAESFYISYGTLHNWKQKIGWISGTGSKYCGRKGFIDKEHMKELYIKGFDFDAIAGVLGCSHQTAQKYLKRMGLLEV